MSSILNAHYVLVAASIAFALNACGREPRQATYTVDQYLADPKLMDQKLQECAGNPGDLKADPDCINAKAAAERDGYGSLRDAPPMGLSRSREGETKTPANESQ